MLEAQRNPKIKMFTLSEVTAIDGFVGNFNVEITQKARYTRPDCNGCGACVDVCPAVAPREFDQGLGPRKAIYIAFPQAVPFKAQIDMDHCIKCGNCQNICELKAVDFNQKDQKVQVQVGGIIMATGWDEYLPEKGYLGFGEYDNVISQLTFERMIAPNGPTVGHLFRPSDGKHPKNMLWINCVGSRDINRNKYCSAGVCCLVSIKNAKLAMGHDPEIQATVAYIDIRAAGKAYEEYYMMARKDGVKFVRSKVVRVREDPQTKNLKVVMEDMNDPQGSIIEQEFDMIILSSSMIPSKSFKKLNKVMNLATSPDGFLKEYHSRLNTVDSDIPGIALAGASHGPKSIAETIMQAKGASSSITRLMSNGEYRMTMIRAIADPAKCARCGMCAQHCPYGAIVVDPNVGAQVNEILCRGCGLCVSVCPSESITVRYYRDLHYNELIDNILAESDEMEGSEQKV